MKRRWEHSWLIAPNDYTTKQEASTYYSERTVLTFLQFADVQQHQLTKDSLTLTTQKSRIPRLVMFSLKFKKGTCVKI